MRQKCSLLALLPHRVLENLVGEISKGKVTKDTDQRKEKVEILLFNNCIIIYFQNAKNSTIELNLAG